MGLYIRVLSRTARACVREVPCPAGRGRELGSTPNEKALMALAMLPEGRDLLTRTSSSPKYETRLGVPRVAAGTALTKALKGGPKVSAPDAAQTSADGEALGAALRCVCARCGTATRLSDAQWVVCRQGLHVVDFQAGAEADFRQHGGNRALVNDRAMGAFNDDGDRAEQPQQLPGSCSRLRWNSSHTADHDEQPARHSEEAAFGASRVKALLAQRP